MIGVLCSIYNIFSFCISLYCLAFEEDFIYVCDFTSCIFHLSLAISSFRFFSSSCEACFVASVLFCVKTNDILHVRLCIENSFVHGTFTVYFFFVVLI